MSDGNNMALWDALSRTDPSQTKGFKRAGGFSGTAIKPMWVWQRLTEKFGPCGKGWGMEKPEFQIVPGHNGEILVFCTVRGWTPEGVVFGVGGDKVVTYIKANEQYNRPERWENDDEAFKKAFTDALMNAFKFVGVGADVHMGKFDDSKYVQAMREEFAEESSAKMDDAPAPRAKLEGPYTSMTALKSAYQQLDRDIRHCDTLDELEGFLELDRTKALIEQLKRYANGYVVGSDKLPAEHVPLNPLIEQCRAHLGTVKAEAENMVNTYSAG